MTPDEIAAIKAAPADATYRDVLALVAEVERLRAALERIGSSLTPLEDRDALARRARRALAQELPNNPPGRANAQTEVERLRAALVKYGEHTDENLYDCSCGLLEALEGRPT